MADDPENNLYIDLLNTLGKHDLDASKSLDCLCYLASIIIAEASIDDEAVEENIDQATRAIGGMTRRLREAKAAENDNGEEPPLH